MQFSIQSIYGWYRNIIRNPKYRWWVILGTLIYILSPFDIAPDFIPIVGEIDDVLLLTLLVSEVSGIVIDGLKAKKGQVDTAANNTDEATNSTSNTIDVDASTVK